MKNRIITASEVDKLFALLRENGKSQAEQDLSGVLGYIALMEKQLAAVTDELRGVRAELSKLHEPGPIMAAWEKLAENLQKQMASIRRQLSAVKAGISEAAISIVAAVKQGGISALDGALRFVHAKEGLQNIRDDLNAAALDAAATRKKVAAISAEYHEAGKHLQNFGRAIRGKEPVAQPKPEGVLSKTAQSFFAGMHGVLAGIASDADNAVARLGRLEVVAAKGKEERVSLKSKLQTYQAALPLSKAPEAGRDRRTENAL